MAERKSYKKIVRGGECDNPSQINGARNWYENCYRQPHYSTGHVTSL
jgi:hypothetical protein